MRIVRRGALFGGLLAASALLAIPAAAADVTVTDAGGRNVLITDASRILSIGGDLTEIVYALGAQGRLVAVDTTSQFPPEALKEKASVGYLRALSTEGVISVGATLIIASERAGPPEVIKTLKTTSVPYVEVPDPYSPQGIAGKVRLVGRALNLDAEAEKLVAQIEGDFKELASQAARIKRPLKAMFVLGVQSGRITVAGQGTAADAIIQLAGATNVAGAVIGYKPLTEEGTIELAPEVIIIMRRTSSNDAHDTAELLALKGVQSTPAGAAKRTIMMDALYLLGFGPRAPRAARELMVKFYPELAGERTEPHKSLTK